MEIKSRIHFIDIAKGITIFLVIWGHTVTNEEMMGPHCPLIIQILYSFHMPLFFFLSGLSISTAPLRTWTEWRAFVKKNILTIAVPYFIWALIYSCFNYTNVAWIFYGSWEALVKVSTLTSLWFLPALFVGKIFTEAVISFTGKKMWVPIAIVLAVVGYVMPYPTVGYPWCFNIGLEAATCILLGVVLKTRLIELQVQRISVLFGLLAACIAVFALGVVFDNEIRLEQMCRNYYEINLWALARAVSGSFAVLLISMILRQLVEERANDHCVKSIIYIGQYTIGIFILHKPFMQQVVIPVMTSLTGDVLDVEVIRFCSAFISMVATLPVCNLIMYYVPELIGIFSKDKIAAK